MDLVAPTPGSQAGRDAALNVKRPRWPNGRRGRLYEVRTSDEEDRLKGFEEGAEDYVVKPFLPRELVDRVKVHRRRRREPPDSRSEEAVRYPGFLRVGRPTISLQNL